MKNIYPLKGEGKWFKGNLHCHSTNSDGRLSPEEVVKIYKEKGYAFLAFSEHELFTDLKEFNEENFIIIPAIERGIYDEETKKCHHIHGIQGNKEMIEKAAVPMENKERTEIPKWDGQAGAQKIIDELIDRGNLVMLNHPRWSLTELEDFKELEGYFAMEIFNYGCEQENKTGLSTIYWDSILMRGKKVWGIATDDNHNKNKYGEASIDFDSFGGWINVKAESLDKENIINALIEGRFYSSSGPEIYDFGIVDGEVYVECSDVKAIYFLTGDKRGYSRRNINGKDINRATYKLTGDEKYVRVECEDRYGKTAWSNPIIF